MSKNIIVALLVSFALIGCGEEQKKEAPAPVDKESSKNFYERPKQKILTLKEMEAEKAAKEKGEQNEK